MTDMKMHDVKLTTDQDARHVIAEHENDGPKTGHEITGHKKCRI